MDGITSRAVALILFVVSLPLIVLVCVCIKLEDGGDILFSQQRVGLNGRLFRLYKFRSMVPEAEHLVVPLMADSLSEHGLKAKQDYRVTRVGRWLRRFSVDEIPQLLNVFWGDMAVVGPRPHLPEELARYGLEDFRRLSVLPGMTGLWQVSGRAEKNFNEQLALDLKYVQTRSLVNDLMILLRTIPAVLFGRGAY